MTRKPTIKELEEILEQGDLAIQRLPNGEIRAVPRGHQLIVVDYPFGTSAYGDGGER